MPAQDNGPPLSVFIEDVSDEEEEVCPCCDCFNWLRAVEQYKRGIYWVIYCLDCGKAIDECWKLNP